MIIGVPKELKTLEYRLGIHPGGVALLHGAGHEVRVEKGAGEAAGIKDADLRAAGATIVESADEVWSAEMVMKVKEPIAEEYRHLREGLVLFTYLHLAAVPELAAELMHKRVRAIAYETIELPDGGLPLLRPMSEVAGKMATQVGASCLEKERGGKGILLGGVPGTRRGHVVILGGGIVGASAARIAIGMGATVTVLDIDHETMANLEDVFQGTIETLYSNPRTIREQLERADLVIGAVLVPGARAPRLVTREMLSVMQKGSVIVDVAVDQGGCVETARPTTHADPTYEVDGIVHYCVANMPGAVPQTSTFALTNLTTGYALRIANQGLECALRKDASLRLGVNCWDGQCTHPAVAQAISATYTPLQELVSDLPKG